MSDTVKVHLVEDLAPIRDDPKVFVRSISTPVGAPWDQARAAALEARLGAPAPLGELVYQVRRLEPWRLGQPSRFAAFYVRANLVRDRLVKTVQVDGRPYEVRFLSAQEQGRRTQRSLIVIAFATLSLLISLASVAAALAARERASVELDNAERLMTARIRQAESAKRLRMEARSLDLLQVRHLKVADFLSDLNWASTAKSPDAHIEALHWEHGAMAVEVRGATPPFSNNERSIRKADRPLRPGVWLWGVSPLYMNGGTPSLSAQ